MRKYNQQRGRLLRFFFQAEDGIRDLTVTGVQTCALPICLNYGDYSYIENFIQDGGSTFPLTNIPRRQQFFSIWIRPVPPVNALYALRQATRELKMLVDRGLSAQDFEATRKYLLNYSRLWAQDQSRRLGYQLDSEFYGTK